MSAALDEDPSSPMAARAGKETRTHCPLVRADEQSRVEPRAAGLRPVPQ